MRDDAAYEAWIAAQPWASVQRSRHGCWPAAHVRALALRPFTAESAPVDADILVTSRGGAGSVVLDYGALSLRSDLDPGAPLTLQPRGLSWTATLEGEREVCHVALPPPAYSALAEVATRPLPSLRPFLGVSDARAEALVALLVEAAQAQHAPDPLYADALAKALATHLAVTYPDGEAPRLVNGPAVLDAARLRRLREWARAHLAGPVAAADLARAAGVAEAHLGTALRGATGETPRRWLRAMRVEAARDAIRAGRPLAEAAQAAGFADQAHMTRAFRDATGTTPGQWRKSQRTEPLT